MPSLRGRLDLRPRRPSSPSRGVAAEVFEDRMLLTAYVVDSLADTVAADGRLTLREAVLAANANAAVFEAAAGQGGGVTARSSSPPRSRAVPSASTRPRCGSPTTWPSMAR